MLVTRRTVGQKLIDYLQHRLPLENLVDWAEQAMMEDDFEDGDLELLRRIVGRIGLADVRAFGMTWEDCEEYLAQLGFSVRIEVSEAQVLA